MKQRLIMIGAVLLGLSIVVGGTLLFFGFRSIVGLGSAFDESKAAAPMPGQLEVDGTGDSLTIWTNGLEAYCEASSPSGPVTVSRNGSANINDKNMVGSFPTEPGVAYVVECEGASGATFYVTDFGAGAIVGPILLTVAGFILGSFLGISGLVLVIIGLIRRSRSKTPPHAPTTAQPAPTGSAPPSTPSSPPSAPPTSPPPPGHGHQDA